MNPKDKVAFLRSEVNILCRELEADAKGKWGKMNAQQMIEHVAGFFDVSSGKIKFDLVTPEEHLPKYKEFLLSDKQFRENTAAPTSVISEEPMPVQTSSITEAMQLLEDSIQDFFDYFEQHPGEKTLHPVFGWLNFDEWVLLHYKHVNHHLRQFHRDI